MNRSMLRQLSALVPLVMSLAALLLVIYQLFTSAHSPGDEEGAAVSVFQLLIVGQAPFAAYFAAKWMPRAPGDAMLILALQAAAAVAALAPMMFFGL